METVRAQAGSPPARPARTGQGQPGARARPAGPRAKAGPPRGPGGPPVSVLCVLGSNRSWDRPDLTRRPSYRPQAGSEAPRHSHHTPLSRLQEGTWGTLYSGPGGEQHPGAPLRLLHAREQCRVLFRGLQAARWPGRACPPPGSEPTVAWGDSQHVNKPPDTALSEAINTRKTMKQVTAQRGGEAVPEGSVEGGQAGASLRGWHLK